MPNRRQFLHACASAATGLALIGRDRALAQGQPPTRRQVSLANRRITVVDAHGHCVVPEVLPVVTGTPMAAALQNPVPLVLGPGRIQLMDEQGIDVQALSVNAFWYAAERGMARDIVRIQNERIAEWCRRHPDRFVGLATVALQFPDLAAEQLDEGVKKLGLRGVAIGGSVEGEELSARKFDPFWAKAEELGVLVFMHPQPSPGTTVNPRLAGKGRLENTIGNPLETTVFLSHLIYDGTLDRFPGLKICAAHGGGFLPSYLGRSEAACARSVEACDQKKKPFAAYFRDQLFVDSMVFREEGLRHLTAELGASQIVYGTDIPFGWPVSVDFILNAPFLDDAQKEAILGGNLKRLLRIAS
jgi:aminocarboxymuconate-semialdehyde decarboxylase